MDTETNDLPKLMLEEGKPCWYREENTGRLHLAFLQGVIVILGEEQKLYIGVIDLMKSLIVNPETCHPIKDGEVITGFIGTMCSHPDYGMGVILDEKISEGILFVSLYRTGKSTFTVPLQEVELCIPYWSP